MYEHRLHSMIHSSFVFLEINIVFSKLKLEIFLSDICFGIW